MTEHEPTNEQAPARTPRRRAPRRGVVLQNRDLAVLTALAEARFLTPAAVEWLFYPWRERYKTYLEQRKTQPALAWFPAANVYRRLSALAGVVPPLLARMTRLSEQARAGPGRLEAVYTLAEAGAELVAETQGREFNTLWYADGRRRSTRNLEHSVQIGVFYAALRAALEHSGLSLIGWQHDQQLAGRDAAHSGPSYDRVRVPGIQEPIAVLPDATCVLDGQRVFVEIDRGLTNLKSWGEKLRGFEAYRGSAALQARYGVADFVVLVVSPTESRQRRIAEEMLKVVRHATDRYRFVTADRVHPTSIRPAWRVVTAFSWERRQVVDRSVEVPGELRWGSAPLWRTAQ
ncbi:MAG TPA: replication-relaxation family protein [Roseiflexaceae bacterium]|nr:replication-relaxation family protein [Roseiflexaceae bacterium]